MVGLIGFIAYKARLIKGPSIPSAMIFSFYLCFVLTMTIFDRVQSSDFHYELDLFWSYRAIMRGSKTMVEQNILNILMFIPIGAILPVLIKKYNWTVPPLALSLSICIELAQLLTRTGLFELDDIINNTLGALIGYALYLVLAKCRERREVRAKG